VLGWGLAVVLAATSTSGTSTQTEALLPSPMTQSLGDVPFTVEAATLEAQAGVYHASGDVRYERPGLVVYADRMQFDSAKQELLADGNVFIVEGRSVSRCDHVELAAPELTGGFERGEMRVKAADPDPGQRSGSQIFESGLNEVFFGGQQVRRTGARSFEIDEGRFTFCDCGPGRTPSWRIRGRHASVDVESGAWVTWPSFEIQGVGIPLLRPPVMYIPFGGRRTGLLMPRLEGTGNTITGLIVTQPLYLVLGDSADVTLEASVMSARGPALGLEGRWAPSTKSKGWVKSNLIFDYGEINPSNGAFGWTASSPLVRYAVALRHNTTFEDSQLSADVNWVGDPAYLSEFTAQFLARQAEWTSSRVIWAAHPTSNVRTAVGIQGVQDLRGDAYPGLNLREVDFFSSDLPGPGDVRYRFAEFRMDGLPTRLGVTGPAEWVGGAALGVSAFVAPSTEVARFVRADFRPALTVPVDLWGRATFEPMMALRMTAWAGSQSDQSLTATRIAPITGARLFTDLHRAYGRTVHQLRPEVQYASVLGVYEGGDRQAVATDDEIDQLTAVSQVRFQLTNDFWDRIRGQRLGGVRAWIAQDFGAPFEDQDSGLGFSEMVLDADYQFQTGGYPLNWSLEGRAAFDVSRNEVAEVRGGLAVSDQRGDAISFGVGRLQAGGPPNNTFIAPEELGPSRTIDRSVYVPFEDYRLLPSEDRLGVRPWSRYLGMVFGIQARLFEPLTVRFNLGLSFDDEEFIRLAYGDNASRSIIRDTTVTVAWRSPCNGCFNAWVSFGSARDRPGFNFLSFGFDLGQLGSVGL
jgi:hypothetical protein